jgi:hypothetical protein
MKYSNVLLILLNFALYPKCTLDAQSYDFLWVNQIGGNSNDKGYSITVDGNGNNWIIAKIYGTVAIGDTIISSDKNFDVFLAKFDSQGNYHWVRQISNLHLPLDIDVDNQGNCLVTGIFYGSADFGDTVLVSNDTSGLGGFYNVFVAKYDFHGNFVWVFQEGGDYSEEANGIAVNDDGSFYIGGSFPDTTTFSSNDLVSKGAYDIFIARYDAEGDLLWAKSAGGQYFDEGRGIDVDPLGNCLITGYFTESLHFADTTISGLNSQDVFTAKYSPEGDVLWARTANGPYVDWPWSIATDPDGNCYITGSFEDSLVIADTVLREPAPSGDIFIAKYDHGGKLLWANQAGGENWDEGMGIAVDHNGNCAVTGLFGAPATFGDTTIINLTNSWDIFIAGYDPDGKPLWVQQAYGNKQDWSYSIASDDQGNFYVTGFFEGPGSFGDIVLNGIGNTDIFIAKLGPDKINFIDGNISSPLIAQLYQNYPNPFNPSTSIEFTLPKSEFVELIVFNILGKEVATLISNKLNQGNHTIQFDGKNLASGVYYYQLVAGDYREVKKMILLR